MHITPYQAIKVWDLLAAAFYGRVKEAPSPYTVRVYTMSCMEHSAAFALMPDSDAAFKARQRARYSLHELLLLFTQERSCEIYVNGGDPDLLLDDDFKEEYIMVTVIPAT